MKLDFRPASFSNFVGQNNLKKILKTMIKAAKIRDEMPDHIFLSGASGYGKTSLAQIIAKNLCVNLKVAQGPVFEKKSDFLMFFANVKKGDVVFIDEFHAINRSVEELFYSILEDNVIDVVVGVNNDAKIIRMKLPSFTLISATTELHKISQPLLNRFGISYQLENYSLEDIQKIILQNSAKTNFKISDDDALLIANYSCLNPRIAINNLKRCIDYSTSNKNDLNINEKDILATFKLLGLHKYGLERKHIEYLSLFKNGANSLSIESISNLLNVTTQYILSSIEPLLIKNSLVEIKSVGRKISNFGMEYLNSL